MMDITEDILSDFREDQEGFSDSTIWSDKKIARALKKADRETGSSRWGAYRDCSIKQEGMFLYAAHLLSLQAAASATTQQGMIATNIAPIASKSVGDESVSFANTSSQGNASSSDSWLESTVYGQQFKKLRYTIATGPICV